MAVETIAHASGALKSVALESNTVKLVPLAHDHADDLIKAASDGRLWELWFTSVPDANQVKEYITRALFEQQNGESIAFAVVDKQSDEIVGSTRLCKIDLTHRRAEIGFTWYAKRCQKTAINTECKLLLLSHAFETMDLIAVELRTHWHNHTSRAAIARLGAKQDGVLRNHQIMADGSYRDTVVFSIISAEWAAVKTSLNFRLSRYA